MEEKEQKSLYDLAKKKIDILEVVVQPEDIAKECKAIADTLKKVGDYKDAASLAKEYEKKSKDTLEQAKEEKYKTALMLAEQAKNVPDYDRSIRMFKSISGYKDAKEQAESVRTKKLSFIKKKNVGLACKVVALAVIVVGGAIIGNNWLNAKDKERLEQDARKKAEQNEAALEEVLYNAHAGDEIMLGQHDWKVVDRDTEKLTLVGIHSNEYEEFSNVKYNETGEETTWENSSLRAWLNGEFFDNAFSEKEKGYICLSDVKNSPNSVYGTDAGNDTQDYLYLLSEEEVEQYWLYTKDMGLNNLLRTPGCSQGAVSYLNSDHEVIHYGASVDEPLTVRPVVQVALPETEKEELDLEEAKAGDTIYFGKYKWMILDMDEEQAVLIGVNSDKYIGLSNKQYHSEDAEVTWETSSLREWLNGEFLDTGFTEEERERILLTKVINPENGKYHTDGGQDTEDYVYLLDEAEVLQYWDTLKDMSLNWFLRTPGQSQNAVSYVSSDHAVNSFGCAVTDTMYLRPVMHISR